jgi:general secretion pathway protein M
MGSDFMQNIRRKSGLDSLEERDRRVLFWGTLVVGCLLVFQLVVLPFWQARQHLGKSIIRKKEELAAIRRLQNEYRSLKAEEGTISARIKQRSPDFTLFTFLDSRAARAGVKKMIKYMKPSIEKGDGELKEIIVEMKLQGAGLRQLVEFLLAIESEKYVVFVKRIAIQQNGLKEGLLDAVLQISTYGLREEK